jgi:ubiquinone/menaquinone biosynthesis C-methylase UbiE
VTHHRGGFHPSNDPGRRQWQDPEAILAAIGLKPGMTFADIGCGAGFFALPAARITGPKGKIYGVDANPASIAALKEEAEKEGLKNLSLTVAEAEAVIPCEQCADFVFFGISLHDFHDPAKVLQNAKRILKPGGKLIDLDWKKEGVPFGPPDHIKFAPAYAAKLIREAGFLVLSIEGSGQYHYLITASLASAK